MVINIFKPKLIAIKEGIIIGGHRSECHWEEAREGLRQFLTIIIWCERCMKKCSKLFRSKVGAGKTEIEVLAYSAVNL